ncbi:MAG TPA: hypothetical protein VNV43_05225 [Candidatus Acidoferrales bacterium]|nr:hypothetical protein [Candidatus Acidoferrales bacterium]
MKLHEIGIRKGSCPASDECIAGGVEAAKKIISSEQSVNRTTAGIQTAND